MVSYKALNTTRESIIPYARHTIGDSNRGQTRATRESIMPYACHTIGDSNRGQSRACHVFAKCFISTICTLNGRKVMT